MAQYPLDMGRPDGGKGGGAGGGGGTLALTVNAGEPFLGVCGQNALLCVHAWTISSMLRARNCSLFGLSIHNRSKLPPPMLPATEGDINYDAVVAQSKNAQKWLQTTHKALVPKPDELLSGVRAVGVVTAIAELPPPVPAGRAVGRRHAGFLAASSCFAPVTAAAHFSWCFGCEQQPFGVNHGLLPCLRLCRPDHPPHPPQNLEKPDEDEIEKTARETAAALSLRVDKKQAAINPKTLPQAPGAAQYIKYTPADAGPQHASGAASRIIKMQDMPVDPLEPPKFRHLKMSKNFRVALF